MLTEVKFIQSIGRFETAKPTRDATFGPCTLAFGENGWGKSTLADILRSLTTNNPAILAGRKTLDADAPPKAVLRFGTQNAVFENGAWTGPRPRILDELRNAVRQFVGRYNAQWLVEKNGFLSPNQAREQWNATMSVRPAA